MDPKEYRRRLEELADIVPIKVKNHKGRNPDEPIVVHRDGEEILIPEDNNHTLAYQVKRLKNDVRKCDDCNKKVKNRTTTKKKYSYPLAHWRLMCNNCNMFQHPETGKFCLVGVATQNVYTQWLKRQHPELVKTDLIAEQIDEKQPELAPVEKKPAK